jgi:DNA-binding SARP family transcriptional activator/WD40 repeat protein
MSIDRHSAHETAESSANIVHLPKRDEPVYPDGVRYGVLGTLAVQDANGGLLRLGGPARRRLLAALLSRPGRVVPVDVLIDDLWADAPPMTAEKTLQSHIVRLRDDLGRSGGTSPLITEPGGYRLEVDPSCIDSWCFERDMGHAKTCMSDGDAGAALALLDQALSWWRGEAYAEFPDAAFAVGERLRLTELHNVALEARTDAALALGAGAELVGELEGRVLVEPYRERTWEQLVVSLYRSGRQGDALGAYQRARSRLVDDLGLEPSAQLRELESRVLAQDPELLPPRVAVVHLHPQGAAEQASSGALALDTQTDLAEETFTPVTTRPVAPECPYPGLRPFGEDDAALFVGRERLTAELAGRLVDNDLVVVVGASGAGKSSLLRAGLVPALRGGGIPGSAAWRITVVTPGTQPTSALAGRLGELVVVDQFEEVFTLGTADTIRAVDARLRDLLATGTRVVLALRADFYDRLTELTSFASRVGNVTVLVGPLTEDETRRAVIQPAQRVGVTVLPAVADQILEDIRGASGSLPLMSAALERAWRERTGDRITLEDYVAGGGVHGALEAMAEEAFSGLGPAEQAAARRILLRLAAHVGGSWVRRPAPAQELAPSSDLAAQRALQELVTWRLVTAGPLTVELTHEALLTRWPRLQLWLDERAAVAEQLEFLGTAAAAWEHDARPAEDVLRGPRLQAALDWESEHPDDFTALEVAYLEASRASVDSELRTERKRRRRLTGIAAGVTVLALVAATLAAVAVRASNSASAAAVVSSSGRLAAESTTVTDPQLAALLAALALRQHDSADSRAALFTALARGGGDLWSAKTVDRVNWVGASNDGKTILVGDSHQNISRVDPVHHTVQLVWGAPGGAFADLSPDGKFLVVCGAPDQGPGTNARSVVIDAQTGRHIVALPYETSFVGQPACGQFTRDGRWYLQQALSSSSADPGATPADQVAVYSVGDWLARPRILAVHPGIVGLAAASDEAALWLQNGQLLILNPATLRVTKTVRRNDLAGCTPRGTCGLAMSPDGRWIGYTTATNSHAPQLLSTSGLEATSVVAQGLAAPITRLGFSPDSRRLAVTGIDGSVLVLAANTSATTLFEHRGTGTGELGLAWSGTGAQTALYTGGLSSLVSSWNLNPVADIVHMGKARAPADDHGNFANGFYIDSYSPPNGPLILFRENMLTGRRDDVTVPLDHKVGEYCEWENFSIDGSHATALVMDAAGNARAIAVDFASHTMIESYRAPEWQSQMGAPYLETALSANGHFLYVATGRQQIRTIDLRTKQIISTVNVNFKTNNSQPMNAFIFTGDPYGRLLVWEEEQFRPAAASSADGITRIWSPDARRTLLLVDPKTGAVTAHVKELTLPTSWTWSPDGRRLAFTTANGTLRIFDSRTLRQLTPGVTTTNASPLTLSWAPDQSMLVASASDGQVSLWDAATLRQLGPGVTLGHNGEAWAFYDKNGSISGYMPSSIDDQRADRWFTMPGTPQSWLKAACTYAGRDLTNAEWTTYVGTGRKTPVCSNT